MGNLCAQCLAETSSHLKKIGVHYETKPSGRVYGTDGTVVDQYPTGRVYDTQGKAYTPSSVKYTEKLAKPLPRATINQSNGMINIPVQRSR